MSWSLTDIYQGQANASSSDLVSGSFTPAANVMLLVVVRRDDGATISGITGHDGGTSWTLIETINTVDANRDGEVWACFTGGSPSAGVITISKSAYMWRCTATVIEIDESVDGLDITNPIADSFGTSDLHAGYDLRNYSVSLPSFADSANLTFAAVFAESSSHLSSFEVGYTAMTASGTSGGSVQPHYLDGEDTTITCVGANWVNIGFWAIEIKRSTGGAIDLVETGLYRGINRGIIRGI